ncbi:SMP-30/gluconolactonase/LRE family protein [Nocardia sp. NPDC059240]|uniref:SMP-30/gluconolactonase/LRE family protein n=1 Tax=Nocardia sp. NPDC059240 TaxID=3346786 RepID=UPI0036830558
MRNRIRSPRSRHRRALLSVGLLTVAAATLTPGPPAVAEPGCTATVDTVVTARIPVLDWAENLAYDRQGNLWVSRPVHSELDRYDSSGRLTATVSIPYPMAVRLGPDGWLYVVSNGLPGALAGQSTVMRFDPAAPDPQQFTAGLLAADGAVFDDDGNLYVSDLYTGVVRIRPDGTHDTAWNARANLFSPNGMVVIGRNLYINVTASLGGQVVRMSLDDPADRSVVADLLPGGMPAFPDDLAVGPDGNLYIATGGIGRLMRLDPATGSVCQLTATEPITAVAVSPTGDLMLSSELGNILRARL